MTPNGEGEFVALARRGDRAAFAALVELYWQRIHRWLYALTRQAHLAEDLTQEVFVKAWIGLPKLQADKHFRPWLFRIAKNLARDSSKGPRGNVSQSLPENVASREPEPLNILLEQEAQQMLCAACDRLPDAYRRAYFLWTQEDLPYSEIAQVLAISEETARWRVCKARQILLKELKPILDQPS